jgi:hypothetical protein
MEFALGYLRAFITLLVVAHHAVIAYNAFAPPLTASLLDEPRFWKAFPVFDTQRSELWSIFNAFNDGFFMALMFFISGLFVWKSLQRKGAGQFIRDRALRLGIPFIVATAFLAPLAYYPSYLQRASEPSLGGFVQQWFALGEWPAGPAWFIWLLLAFDAAIALIIWLHPRSCAGVWSTLRKSPALFATVLVGASVLLVVPPMLLYGPEHWVAFGPFHFQTSRLGLYALYFMGGVLLGAAGIQQTFLGTKGALERRWLVWAIVAPLAFVALGALSIVVAGIAASGPSPELLTWGGIAAAAFVVSCAASSFALLAVFLRFVNRRGRLMDSLRDNAYGIYLVHYVYASWLQLVLVAAPLDALTKGVVISVVTLGLSWLTVACVRRIPVAARVI